MTTSKNYILDKVVADRKMRRMALEILENNAEETELILAGISENGSAVARGIQRMLQQFSKVKIKCITLTLDKKKPGDIKLSESLDFNDKVVIVIDDVANSGKTLLYSLKPFLAYHPKKIQTLVLVERSHNSFPVHPDYSGICIATTLQEHIYVEVDGDTITGAYLQ